MEISFLFNQGLLTEGFFWIPSLAGPTTIAARQSGSGVSWLFPFVVRRFCISSYSMKCLDDIYDHSIIKLCVMFVLIVFVMEN